MGYGIIAIPTGIVTSEIISGEGKPISNQACPECSLEGHDADARYCKHCGSEL
jgi:voltage-gated potassium channel